MLVKAKQFATPVAFPRFQFVGDGLYFRIDAIGPRRFTVIDRVTMLRSEIGES
jgi:hypothetical protein